MNAPFTAETANTAEPVADEALTDLDAKLAFLQRASALCLLVERDQLSIDEAFPGLIEPFMAIMGPDECASCGCCPCQMPTFCALCLKADKRRRPPDERTRFLQDLMDGTVSLDKAWRLLNERRPTPEATIEAVKHCVRECGPDALDEPSCRARLRDFDDAALAELDRWLSARGVK